MPWNVLILPLIGGFWFAARWNRTRFNFHQLPKEWLLITAATFGVLLLVAARLVSLGIAALWPDFADFFTRNTGNIPGLGTSIVAFSMGFIAPDALNRWGERLADHISTVHDGKELRFKRFKLWLAMFWVQSRDLATHYAVTSYGDYLEKLLYESFADYRLLMFTTRGGKVFVGWVTDHPCNIDIRNNYFKLMPLMTGFRDERLAVHLTVEYKPDMGKKVIKVLRMDEILDACRFDLTLWRDFEKKASKPVGDPMSR